MSRQILSPKYLRAYIVIIRYLITYSLVLLYYDCLTLTYLQSIAKFAPYFTLWLLSYTALEVNVPTQTVDQLLPLTVFPTYLFSIIQSHSLLFSRPITICTYNSSLDWSPSCHMANVASQLYVTYKLSYLSSK